MSSAGLIVVAVLALLYLRGLNRWRGTPPPLSRHFAFAVGLLLFLLSSTWPLESLAHIHFAIHEAVFLALRIAAPMLIAVSHPRALLFRGIPVRLRRSVLPMSAKSLARRAWREVCRPAPVLLIYLATLILWAIPDLQDHALRNAVVALLLHASLFLSGLLFWSRIFDRGAGPRAVSHGSRLMMLWFAILAQILVGSATSMKTRIWYPAYRAGLADEAIGGILLWIPSSLLTLLGLIFVIHLWGRHETRLDLRRTTWSPSNSVILLYPESARSLRAMAAPKNKQMALSMLAFAAFIFAAAITTAFAYRLF